MVNWAFLTETAILDESIVTFIVDAIKSFVELLTTPPLGIFLTIGILGTVIGLVRSIVRTVKRG